MNYFLASTFMAKFRSQTEPELVDSGRNSVHSRVLRNHSHVTRGIDSGGCGSEHAT